MGLLDGLAGAVLNNALGGGQQGDNQMGSLLNTVLAQAGGIGGLIGMLQQAGLGQQAASWVGTGANQSVSADQLQSALGSGMIGNLASQFGISPEVLSQQLAQHLPQIIDHATPNGQVDSNSGDLLSQVLGQLIK